MGILDLKMFFDGVGSCATDNSETSHFETTGSLQFGVSCFLQASRAISPNATLEEAEKGQLETHRIQDGNGRHIILEDHSLKLACPVSVPHFFFWGARLHHAVFSTILTYSDTQDAKPATHLLFPGNKIRCSSVYQKYTEGLRQHVLNAFGYAQR